MKLTLLLLALASISMAQRGRGPPPGKKLGSAFGNLDQLFKNLRPLRGGSFIKRVHKECKRPLEEFGYCFVGFDNAGRKFGSKSPIGRSFLKKAVRKVERLRRNKNVQRLEAMGKKVDRCFDGCALTPIKAVKCFLDFLLNGGPYDRVAQCLVNKWRVPGNEKPPKPSFGDLSGMEKDLKLFAGIGLYKRLYKNNDKFWSKYGAQVANMCPEKSLSTMKTCVNNALKYNSRRNNWLALPMKKIMDDPSARLLPVANPDVIKKLSWLGEPDDVEAFLDLVKMKIIGCSIDLFGSAGTSSIGRAMAALRSTSPCAVPKCIQFVWTIKEGICDAGLCRTSLSKRGLDPFGSNGVKPFLDDVSKEFVDTVTDRRYQCQVPDDPTVCTGCKKAANTWKRQGTDLLKGFEQEAVVVAKLLQQVCNMGANNAPISDGDCRNY